MDRVIVVGLDFLDNGHVCVVVHGDEGIEYDSQRVLFGGRPTVQRTAVGVSAVNAIVAFRPQRVGRICNVAQVAVTAEDRRSLVPIIQQPNHTSPFYQPTQYRSFNTAYTKNRPSREPVKQS
jgi:hypothetical protein